MEIAKIDIAIIVSVIIVIIALLVMQQSNKETLLSTSADPSVVYNTLILDANTKMNSFYKDYKGPLYSKLVGIDAAYSHNIYGFNPSDVQKLALYVLQTPNNAAALPKAKRTIRLLLDDFILLKSKLQENNAINARNTASIREWMKVINARINELTSIQKNLTTITNSLNIIVGLDSKSSTYNLGSALTIIYSTVV